MNNNKYLITASLYSSYHYYAKTNFEIYGERADEIEQKALQDWIDTLNKVKKPTNEILQRGIDFENEVLAICNGKTDSMDETAKEIASKVAGGMWQETLCKTIDNYVFYGKADVIRGNTIFDIKRVSQYECPKYEQSIQHLLYLECSPLEHFKYEISDGKNTYEEYYHKDVDNRHKLLSRTNEMVGFIRRNKEFNKAFEANWHSKY